PELPDITLIENVRFSTRIRNALNAAGMKTIGEVRETSDDTLLSLPDLGPGSVAHLRKTLGAQKTLIDGAANFGWRRGLFEATDIANAEMYTEVLSLLKSAYEAAKV